MALYAGGTYAFDMIDVKIDETTLTQISETTGRQSISGPPDNESLKNIYGEIDQMEKTLFEVKEQENSADRYSLGIGGGLGFPVIGVCIENLCMPGEYRLAKICPTNTYCGACLPCCP